MFRQVEMVRAGGRILVPLDRFFMKKIWKAIDTHLCYNFAILRSVLPTSLLRNPLDDSPISILRARFSSAFGTAILRTPCSQFAS
jgi:hypothetical protein